MNDKELIAAYRKKLNEAFCERDGLVEAIVTLLTLAGYPTPDQLRRLVEGEE